MSDSSHPARLTVADLLDQCDVRRQRRSGPGGQHRNKVETAVFLVHRASGCVGEASERRSQEQNRQAAIQRLRVELALAVRSQPEEATGKEMDSPSELWQRRMASGGRVNPGHEDYPALLSEALDVLAARQWNVSDAARHLNCSTSQLVKLLKAERRALQQLNQARREAGLRDLR